MPSSRVRPLPRGALLLSLLAACLALATAPLLVPGPDGGGHAALAQDGPAELRILGSQPFTWDPALAGDAGSASMLAQVFEGLTAFDANSRVQPALAADWEVAENGRQITFNLRDGLRYSDGSPLLAEHVVESWLRLIDPARPSPLAGLLNDVEGATDYLGGRVGRDAVGLSADGQAVTVDLRRPATYFLAVTASPSLAVVPPAMHEVLPGYTLGGQLVVSGAYLPAAGPAQTTASVIRLTANPNYWAGLPPIESIDVLTDLGGRSPVAVFQAGEVDYTDVASFDASWIRYDPALGPQLRQTESFSVHYYGFDTQSEPFDDARVRLAFAQAVDWRRIVELAGDAAAATSLVPPGIPARGTEDFVPEHDPQAARQLLVEAGYPEGEGFPDVALISFGYGYEVTVASELEETLGISVPVELIDFQGYIERLEGDQPPAFWTLSWIADYPHAHDFLGLLLESGSSNNYGGWSNAEFDAAIEAAAAAGSEAEQADHYTTAQRILREQVPVIPVEYGESWALSREGLLGALESGVGMIRYAGLDWAEGYGP